MKRHHLKQTTMEEPRKPRECTVMERGSSTGQVKHRGQNSGLKTVPTGFGNKEATVAEHIQKSVRRRRNLGIFAAGDDYVLGHDLPLQHAQLGMVATATEKPRRFCLEVSNPLSEFNHNTEAIFFQ